MTRKDWYIIGLVVCVIMYILVFVLAIVNYQARVADQGITMFHFHTFSDFVVQRNTLLLLNPFWIGIIIFGVLLVKSKD